MLDRQIHIMSVDTGNFYSNKECVLHWKNHKLRIERNELIKEINNIKNIFSKYGISESDLKMMVNDEYDNDWWNDGYSELFDIRDKYLCYKEWLSIKNDKIKITKNKLLSILSNKVDSNIKSNGRHHTRKLRNINPSCNNKADIFKHEKEPLENNKLISVFDSFFTRTIGAKQDKFCDDFMVIQVYYFDIIKDLIYYGFEYNNEKYIYFTSSAGQIRTKKTVFVKESVWKKYEKTIMCGLTIDAINSKGGNNSNKYLAYMALSNSATDVWEEFDIDKSIVVDDFETNVFGTCDFVNDEDYSIKRMDSYIPIPHTDGCGMMLPNMGKNRMVRLPWIKGLLGSFDFVKFIKEYNCSPIVKDIYGVKHNIIDEDINIIFTKSQLKAYKFYDSWEQYKDNYKKYNCTAGYTNIELDRIKDARINYQMLQSLTDISQEDILEIASHSTNKLNNICSSIKNVKELFGCTPYNTHKTSMQKAIDLYPDLLNDEFFKVTLRNIKDSIVKQYKAGKLHINGKYTFILPDLFAFCEYLFMGIEEPKGLLDNGEVFCSLFKKSEKVDCLRSPHLYKEHAVRKNLAWYECEKKCEIEKWFTTKAIYTSTHDLISKILMFDVDGDNALVVSNKKLIDVAERNTKEIVPLFYNMRKASPVILNNETIYDGLNKAFTSSNIGIYSNNISKIYNSNIFINGTDEDKSNAMDIIKLLCMENNFCIDSAKTLYMPTRPQWFSNELKKFTNNKLPHFFKYAKDKMDSQVENVNESFVNKLDKIIVSPRLNFRNIGFNNINYKLLMNDEDIKFDVLFDKNGNIIKDGTEPLIIKYLELCKMFHFKIDASAVTSFSADVISKSKSKHDLIYKRIIDKTKSELSQFGYSDVQIVDILVKYLYEIKNNKYKGVLWFCYGNIIYDNLRNKVANKNKEVQCEYCGNWFETNIKDNRKHMCHDCYIEYRKKYKAENEKMRRNKVRGQNKT